MSGASWSLTWAAALLAAAAGCTDAPGPQAPTKGAAAPPSKTWPLPRTLLKDDNIRRTYTRSARVRMKLGTDPKELAGGGVWIHVTRDNGQTWEKPPRKVALEENAFVLDFNQYKTTEEKKRPEDIEGEFGFKLVKANAEPPALGAGSKPDRYLVIDRTPPFFKFNLPPQPILGSSAGARALFTWTCRDNIQLETPSHPRSISIEWSENGGETWKFVTEGTTNNGTYEWRVPAIHRKEVVFRATAKDASGNATVRQPEETRAIDGIPPSIKVKAAEELRSKTGELSIPFETRKVGSAKLESVRVHVTANEGQKWEVKAKLPPESPAVFNLKEEGAYGIQLVAVDAAGNHSPEPASGDRPALFAVVDRHPPELAFSSSLAAGQTYQKGEEVTLRWEARDANLKREPVELFYRTDDDQTHPIGGPRAARGSLVWPLPAVQGRIVLVAMARDRVDNVTTRFWPPEDDTGQKAAKPDQRPPVLSTWPLAQITRADASADRTKIEIEYEVRDLGKIALEKVELWYRSGGERDWLISRETGGKVKDVLYLADAPAGTYDFYVRAIASGYAEPAPTPSTPPKLANFLFNPRVPTLQLVQFPGSQRGEVYPGGHTVTIEWKKMDGDPQDVTYTVLFSPDNGQTWEPVREKLQGQSKIDWKLPAITAEKCKIEVRAASRMGARATGRIPGWFGVDVAAPRTAEVKGPALTNTNALTFIAHLADVGPAGVQKVRLWYQREAGQPWQPVREDPVGEAFRSQFVYQMELKTEATYRFAVTGTDRVGNQEPAPAPAQAPHYVVTLDRTPPAVTLEDTFASPVHRVGSEATFRWKAEDARLAPAGATLLYSTDDGASWVAFAQELPAAGSHTWKLPVVLDGKAVRFQAQVRDLAGNVGQGDLARTVMVGTKPLVVSATGPARSASPVVKIAYRMASLDPRAKLAWIQVWYSSDGVSWVRGARVETPDGSPVEQKLPGDGRYGLILQARDTVGEEEAEPVRGAGPELSLEVDSQPPVVALRGLDQEVFHGQSRYRITWDKVIDNNLADKPVSLFYRSPPEQKWVPIVTDAADTQSHDWEVPGSGRYRLKIVAVDRLGNKGEKEAAADLVVSTRAPKVTIVGPAETMQSARSVLVRFTLSSEQGIAMDRIALHWTLDGGKTWNQLTTIPLAGTSVTRAEDGSYSLRHEGQEGKNGIYLVAWDRAGNHNSPPAEGTSPMVTFVIDTQAPVVKVDDRLKGLVFGPGEQATLSWTVQEANPGEKPITVRLSADSGYTWPIVLADGIPDQGKHTFRMPDKPPISGRYYRVRVEAKDRVGLVGSAVTEIFSIDAKPPTASFVDALDHTDKATFNLQAAISDEDGAGVGVVEVYEAKLDVRGLPLEAWKRRALDAWAPGQPIPFQLEDGSWGLLLVATDKKGNRQEVRAGDEKGQPTLKTPPMHRILVHAKGPGVVLLSLTGGETFSGGQPMPIRWSTAQGLLEITRVALFFSKTGGKSWSPIPGAEGLQNTGRFEWQAPTDRDYRHARVKVEVYNRYGQKSVAASGADFFIDNGKPDEKGVQVEEVPEVKGWLSPEEGRGGGAAGPGKAARPAPGPVEEWEKLAANAVRHYLAGSLAEAEKAASEALKLKGTWARGHYLLALVHQQQGKPAETVRMELQTATAFDPDLAEAYNDLGFLLYRQQKYGAAATYFQKALAAKPAANGERNQSIFRYNLGLALLAGKQPGPALKEFKEAAKLQDRFREAWYYVAVLAAETGDREAERGALEALARLHPPGSQAHRWAEERKKKLQ